MCPHPGRGGPQPTRGAGHAGEFRREPAGGRFPWRFPAKRGAEWWFNPWKNGENMVLEAEKLGERLGTTVQEYVK